MKLFLLFFGLLSISAEGFAAPHTLNPPNERTIQWVVHDLPPVIQLASADLQVDLDKAQGPMASMYKTLAASLKDYQHRFLRVPLGRADRLFKEHKHFCTLLLQENEERKKFLLFGEEVAVSLPLGLVTLASLPAERYISTNNKVQMKATLENKPFRLGLVKGRFYGPGLSRLVTQNMNSYSFVNDGAANNLFAMLEKDRLDGVLAYYLEMANYEQKHTDKPELEFHRVSEADNFSVIRASCEKSKWGEQALKAISKVVKEKKFKELSHQYLLSVLPLERRKEYQKIYDSRPNEINP